MIGPHHSIILLLHLDRARRGGVDRALCATTGRSARAHVVGQLQHAHEHRRHPLAVRDAVLLDQAQRVLGIELLHARSRCRRGASCSCNRTAAPSGTAVRATGTRCRSSIPKIAVSMPISRGHGRRCGSRLDLVLDALRPARRARRVEHRRAFELLGQRLGGIAVARVGVRLVAVDESLADHEPELDVRHLAPRARSRASRYASEMTSTCASQSSRMYAASSALKCQLMHV